MCMSISTRSYGVPALRGRKEGFERQGAVFRNRGLVTEPVQRARPSNALISLSSATSTASPVLGLVAGKSWTSSAMLEPPEAAAKRAASDAARTGFTR